jgi:pimeloyl-ACP methyl ester carboxylesterase
VIDAARQTYASLSVQDILRGVKVFYTRRSRDDTLATYSGSVTFVSGAEDIAPGPETSAAQARTAPDGIVEIIPDCGHYVPLEKPDQFNEIVRRVISTLDVG